MEREVKKDVTSCV